MECKKLECKKLNVKMIRGNIKIKSFDIFYMGLRFHMNLIE